MSVELIVGGIVLLAVLGYFIDREVYFYEGMRLGPRLQRWLYDRWAASYDKGKQASQLDDENMLAKPILSRLAGHPHPLVLDLATGTGRLPLALLGQPSFAGKIIALDISPKMLDIASSKLQPYHSNLSLIQYLTLPLPFPDASFDVVCCLEALEVMPEMEPPLEELQRVLRPGGLLVTSRGTEASGRKAKIRSAEQFTSLLHEKGFEQVEIAAWWKYFDRVFATKPGELTPLGVRDLPGVLRCKACEATRLEQHSAELVCAGCGARYPYSPGQILVY